MKTNYSILLIVVSLFFCIPASRAQDYNIIDDTIRFSSSSWAELKFMNEPEFQKMSEDYEIQQLDRSLTIKPKKGVTAKNARLKVTEGTRNKRREHYFIVVYDKHVSPSEQDYDFSSLDLIKKRIELLAKSKEKAVSKKQAKAPKRSEEQQIVVVGPEPDEEPVSRNSVQKGGEEEMQYLRSIPEKRIQDRIKTKINYFNKWCSQLCNKQYPYSKKEIIDRMMKSLFENKEEVIVQTFNPKSKQKSDWKIRDYFVRLTKFRYSNVTIKSSDIRFITKLKQISEDEYEGTVVVIQDFEAYIDKSILAYKDQTQKSITVRVKLFETVDEEGNKIDDFEVYLGDIKVDNTIDS